MPLLEKTHVYKQYHLGMYVGTLKNVISEFEMTETINTPGTYINIDLGVAFKDANARSTKTLLINETNDYISTDIGDHIIVGLDTAITGFPVLNDRIEVWEYSDYYPNGILRFNGLVSKWESGYASSTTTLTVLSYGVALDNFLIQILPEQILAGATALDSALPIYAADKTSSDNIGIAQTFTVGAISEVNSLYVAIENNSNFSVAAMIEVYEGTPFLPGALVGSVTRSIPANTPMSEYLFRFSSGISLRNGSSYFIQLTNPYGSTSTSSTLVIAAGFNSTNSYPNGAMYTLNNSGGYSANSGDMFFRVVSSTGGIGNQFLSYDPSNIAKSLIDTFQSLGGQLRYTPTSIVNSGTIVSYTFKFNTFLEGLKKSVELAPSNWWWGVHPGTGVVSFKPLKDVADHTFIFGNHIDDLEISQSLEQVVNTVYYTGGDNGSGLNVLVDEQDSTSVSQYGTWLDTPSDNRVTTETTARILAKSLVNQNKDPRFMTKVVVAADKYNLASIEIGQIIGFQGADNIIDDLKLQVMQKSENRREATLTLALLPPTQTKRIEDIKRNLDNEQTRNNPNT